MPILTTNVLDIQSINGNLQGISLKDNISILGFWGGDVNLRKSEALNLNQKIYRRFSQFQDFQFVFLTTKDQETNINNLKEELIRGVGTDLEKWNFISKSVVGKSRLVPFNVSVQRQYERFLQLEHSN